MPAFDIYMPAFDHIWSNSQKNNQHHEGSVFSFVSETKGTCAAGAEGGTIKAETTDDTSAETSIVKGGNFTFRFSIRLDSHEQK